MLCIYFATVYVRVLGVLVLVVIEGVFAGGGRGKRVCLSGASPVRCALV